MGQFMVLFLYALLLSGALSLPAQSILAPANLTAKVKFNKLTPGTVLETTLDQPVYDGASQLLPAGSRLQLTLASITKQKPHSSTLRRIGALATGSPLPKPDYKITLRSATLVSPDGRPTPVNAEVLGLTIQRRLLAKGQALSSARQPNGKLVLRLTGLASSQSEIGRAHV